MAARAVLWSVAAALLTFAPSAAAIELAGHPRVVDGDGLVINGNRIRLHGIDAPEMAQRCEGRRRVPIACGELARNALAGLIGEQEVRCETVTVDRFKRSVAVCRVGGLDLGREMVRLGWARAFARYSDVYIAGEAEAREARRGLRRLCGEADQPLGRVLR